MGEPPLPAVELLVPALLPLVPSELLPHAASHKAPTPAANKQSEVFRSQMN
jgi:hypothetical protein